MEKNDKLAIAVVVLIALVAVYFVFVGTDNEDVMIDDTDTQITETKKDTTNTTTNTNTTTKKTETPQPVVKKSSGVALGQDFSLGDVRIVTTSIIEDSRCPTGTIRCAWEGKVRVIAKLRLYSMSIDKPDKILEFTLGVPQEYDEYMVNLISASPYPEKGKTVRDSDYRFTWEVSEKEI